MKPLKKYICRHCNRTKLGVEMRTFQPPSLKCEECFQKHKAEKEREKARKEKQEAIKKRLRTQKPTIKRINKAKETTRGLKEKMQICLYCKKEIQPLDKDGAYHKSSKCRFKGA